MSTFAITDFSPHLFWDVNPESLDMEKHKKYIIGRTLDYGLTKDWRLIVSIRPSTYFPIQTLQVSFTSKSACRKKPGSESLLKNIVSPD